MEIHVNDLLSRKRAYWNVGYCATEVLRWLRYLENVFNEALPSNVLLQFVVPKTRFNYPLSSNRLLRHNNITSLGIYTAVMDHIMVFYFEISCSLVDGYRRFEGICCLHLQDWILFLERSVFSYDSIPHPWRKNSFRLKRSFSYP
jgi:hypothetical protein